MLTTPSMSTPSWSSRIVARVAQAYGVSPATLVSRRRDPLLVEARRVAMGLLAERGLGPGQSHLNEREVHCTEGVREENERIMMTPTPDVRVRTHFAAVDDPQVDRTKRHQLLDILTIAL